MNYCVFYLLTKAILVYRAFRNVTKLYVKILHGLIHVAVLIFASIALKAVFDSHNKVAKPIPNLYRYAFLNININVNKKGSKFTSPKIIRKKNLILICS